MIDHAAPESSDGDGGEDDREEAGSTGRLEEVRPAALGHLAAAMAHELRNALNSVAIHVELLESRLKKSEAVAAEIVGAAMRSLSVMRQEVQRSDDILERYLSRVGPREAARRPMPVRDLLAAAAGRAQGIADGRGVRIEADSGDLSFAVDAAAIELSLDALVQNAVEASPEGGLVRLRADLSDEGGVIEIADQGPGIPPAVRAKMYELGYTTRPGHAGVGLAIAKQAIRGQGGSLSIRPATPPDAGTIVRVELLLETDDDKD